MKIQMISTGSKGNSYLITTKENNYYLIDFGITLSKLKKYVDIKELKAIFITHIHNDHILGLKNLKYDIPIIAKGKTKEYLENNYSLNLLDDNINKFEDISFDFFELSHDVENYGIIIKDKINELVYITDTGYIPQKYYSLLKDKSIYLVESNYDDEMIMHSEYPYYLIQRIVSDIGHLSNYQTSKFLSNVIGKNTKKVLLIHLSEHNNTKEACLTAINKIVDFEVSIINEEEVVIDD
ncbi:MAG: MBL fold metallo-hydrolase [Clostridiales bacterium]|jgi:metal-dependent hydrolase of the beta-lactamase superfamily I|nr:MBL fold metallo-hydrolase [Clostridiales bacterium]